MTVILLSSTLQAQPDTKIIPDKKATLMTGRFLLADSMLKVYQDWEIKKLQPYLSVNLHNEIYYLLYVYWIKRVGKS